MSSSVYWQYSGPHSGILYVHLHGCCIRTVNNMGSIPDTLLSDQSKLKAIVPYYAIYVWGSLLSEISLFEPCGWGESKSYYNIKVLINRLV